jgi:ABC-type transport system substrate-binding protein
VDIAYSITGPLAEELKRTPGLTLAPTFFPFTIWLVFTEQWDTKSPWHDKRVRLATNYAIDRQGINQAVYLGYSKLAYSFVPQGMEYYWAPPPYPYDPKRAKALLAEAGYPNGFDAGDLSAEAIYSAAIGEPVVNYLRPRASAPTPSARARRLLRGASRRSSARSSERRLRPASHAHPRSTR